MAGGGFSSLKKLPCEGSLGPYRAFDQEHHYREAVEDTGGFCLLYLLMVDINAIARSHLATAPRDPHSFSHTSHHLISPRQNTKTLGKKRKNMPSLDESLGYLFCHHCERDFDDDRILIAINEAN